MNSRLSKIELFFTAVILIAACCGIGMTVHKRVDKHSGTLTTENYAEYMQVSCSLGKSYGGGNAMTYTYYITVTAVPYYRLENVTVSYSLESDGASLPDDTFTATVEAGKTKSKECEDIFRVTLRDDMYGAYDDPSLKITVRSVTGTYRYSA